MVEEKGKEENRVPSEERDKEQTRAFNRFTGTLDDSAARMLSGEKLVLNEAVQISLKEYQPGKMGENAEVVGQNLVKLYVAEALESPSPESLMRLFLVAEVVNQERKGEAGETLVRLQNALSELQDKNPTEVGEALAKELSGI